MKTIEDRKIQMECILILGANLNGISTITSQ